MRQWSLTSFTVVVAALALAGWAAACSDGASSQPVGHCVADDCYAECAAGGSVGGACVAGVCRCVEPRDLDAGFDLIRDARPDSSPDAQADVVGDPSADPEDDAAADLTDPPDVDAASDLAADAVDVANEDMGIGGPGPHLYWSQDFGAPEAFYGFEEGAQIGELKLHSTADGDLTLYLDHSVDGSFVMRRPAGRQWSAPQPLPQTASAAQNLGWGNMVRTDTRSGTFTTPKLVYLANTGSVDEPWGPATIYLNDLGTADDRAIAETQAYYADYFSTFYPMGGTSLYEEPDGTLHVAEVENYELYYLVSEDGGLTWRETQVVTGHEGGIRAAGLVVDHDGAAFIGFSTNDWIDYANPTGVVYGNEGHLDLYCAHNADEGWSIELVGAHNAGNYGPWLLASSVASNNDVSLYASHFMWGNRGGELWEYTRSSEAGTWSGPTDVVSFDDTAVDHGLYLHASVLTASDDTTTAVLSRHRASPTGSDDQLLYAQRVGGVWGSPVEIDTPLRGYVTGYQFDAAIDGDDHIYVAYLRDAD